VINRPLPQAVLTSRPRAHDESRGLDVFRKAQPDLFVTTQG